MTIDTQPQLTIKQRRQDERKRLKIASLNEQLAWWAAPERLTEGFQVNALRAECKRIEKRRRRLGQITPSSRWHEDACGLRLTAGGEFPPCDPLGLPLMVKALGESRFYPSIYLTSSGHSFDTFVEAVYTGASAQLMEDGYMGGRVTINTLAQRDRQRIHLMEARAKRGRHGEKHITNIF